MSDQKCKDVKNQFPWKITYYDVFSKPTWYETDYVIFGEGEYYLENTHLIIERGTVTDEKLQLNQYYRLLISNRR